MASTASSSAARFWASESGAQHISSVVPSVPPSMQANTFSSRGRSDAIGDLPAFLDQQAGTPGCIGYPETS